MARSRPFRFARLSAGIALVALTTTGCTVDDVEDALRFGWPRGITSQAEDMRQLWTWSTVTALIVGVIVWALIFWTITMHRRSRRNPDHLPKQTAYNLPLEVIYTALPFLIVAGLFYFTVVSQNYVMRKDEAADVNVTVTGFKWNWQFTYDDVEDEESDEAVSTVGSTEEIPILVLPAGNKVKFALESNDVIHSFWVPEFLFKLDVVPGMDNGDNNVFVVDIDDDAEGAYVGRCAELCGTYHGQMNFELRVVSPEDFDSYLDARADGMSNAEALESIGEPSTAVTTSPFDSNRTQAEAAGAGTD